MPEAAVAATGSSARRPDAAGRIAPTARLGLIAPSGLFLIAFGMYWATLARGVLGGDAGELQFVPAILGLTHPTGYPLQVLVHWAWGFLPIGTVAYRLNLLDALIAAGAVSLVAACGRCVAGRWLPALLGAATFAFGELWWSQAVSGDKYTLNGLVLALVLLLYVRWRSGRDAGALRVLAFAYGLGLTHHRSMLLVGPALALGLVLEGWRPRDRREPLALLGLAALPLLLYLYLPWAGSRGLPPGTWSVDTPGALVEYLLDCGYTSQLHLGAELPSRLVEAAGLLVQSFGPLGALVGLFGLAWTARQDWRLALVLGVVFAVQAVSAASYRLESNYALPRHWVFYLPALLIWSLWLTAGLGAALGAIERGAGRGARGRVVGAALLTAVFLLGQGVTVWARSAEAMVRAQVGAETLDGYRQDLQRSPLAERFGRLALESAEPNAVLVCDWEQATVLWYLQRVEGRRPDLLIRYPIEQLDETLAEAQGRGRPVYVSRTLPDLAARGVPSSAGPLLRILPEPSGEIPTDVVPVDARLEDGVTLVGVAYHADRLRVGGVLPLTLSWRADRPLDEDYAVAVQLVRIDAPEPLAEHRERHPALGTSPTTGWRPGTLIGDYHELPLGNRLPPGSYRVAVRMYRPKPLRHLRQLDPDGQPHAEAIALPLIEVAPREPTLLDALPRLRP